MPVCYGVARWSYGGDTVHTVRATVMPRTKLALFCTPVRPGCYKKIETTGTTSQRTPVKHSVSRFNAVLAGVATVWTENRDSVNQDLRVLQLDNCSDFNNI